MQSQGEFGVWKKEGGGVLHPTLAMLANSLKLKMLIATTN
jgi:hypothetical protein